jgi:hypothetical protein
MAVRVETVLDDRIAQYVNRVKAQRHATEAAIVQELVEAGYAEAVRQLHARYHRGNSRSVQSRLNWGSLCASYMTFSGKWGCRHRRLSDASARIHPRILCTQR